MQLMKSSSRLTAVAVAAVAATALVPAGAQAAAGQFKGTVVAKDGARQTVVTASASGKVRTVRVAKGVKKYRVGQRLVVRGAAAADGTYAARKIRVNGRARKARVRAAVVKRTAARYLVTAGKSTFSIRRKARGAASASSAINPGDIIVADVMLGDDGPTGTNFDEVGHTRAIELEGIYLGQENGQLELAVERRGRVFVTVPDGLTVTAQPGDEVELLVTIDGDSFVLIALDGDDDENEDGDNAGDDDHGMNLDMDDEGLEIRGLVTEVTDSSITVSAGPDASVTCIAPAGSALADSFPVGDEVKIECGLAGDGFVLREIESETSGNEFEVDDADDDHGDDHGGKAGDDGDDGDDDGEDEGR
jgi:hypothetical protein